MVAKLLVNSPHHRLGWIIPIRVENFVMNGLIVVLKTCSTNVTNDELVVNFRVGF